MRALLGLSGLAASFLACPALADPIAFADMTGRAVTLPAPAERIASIPIPLASTIIALDERAYRVLYGYTPDEADIDGILWLDQQGTAANYVAFKAK